MSADNDHRVTVSGPGGDNGHVSVSAVYKNVVSQGDGVANDASNLYELWQRSVRTHPNNDCLGWREPAAGDEAPFQWLSYEAVDARVDAIGSSLMAAGVTRTMRVGIFAANCPEWMMTMQACNRQSLQCVPLYDTLGENAVEYIIVHSEVSAIFVASSKLPKLAASLQQAKGKVKVVVWWGPLNAAAAEAIDGLGVRTASWDEFLAAGQAVPQAASPPGPEDLCTIMYTSGTTGPPKGVMITHSAMIATSAGQQHFWRQTASRLGEPSGPLGPKDSMLSYLPLAHIYGRVAEESFLHSGGSIGYWRGNVQGLMNDIAALKPTFFIGVPRVFDRIYSAVTARTKAAGGIKAWLYNFGFSWKLGYLNAGYGQKEASPLFDRIVFSKVKAALGGRVRAIVSGGAPLARHVEDFLKVTMCCPVVQGYGLTETCAASFVSTPDQYEHAGSVGFPLPPVMMRLESCPELGYDAQADPPCGEVCLRGPSLFSGYYKQPELTAEVMDDQGWFHTGDVGMVTKAGTLQLIDRKKNVFKLSQGEYIAVEQVEAVLKQNPALEQLWVYGNSFESCLVAVVVPAEAAAKSWAASAGLEGEDYESICRDPKTGEWLLSELTKTGKAGSLQGFQLVKGVIVESKQWSVEDELMTPSFKLKRPQLQKKYQAQIDALYKQLGGGQQQQST